MSTPNWEVLIVSVTERGEYLKRMLGQLLPMAEAHDGHVRVSVYVDDFQRARHEARNLLVQRSAGDYVCFVDDDDRLPDYYCDRVVEAIAQEPDYVGWRMQAWWDGEKLKPTYHSLRYAAWSDDDAGYYRHVSHLNPARTDLVRQVPFPAAGSEDYEWAQRMYASGLLQREVYIEEPMYYYDFDTSRSLTNPSNRTHARPDAEIEPHPLLDVLGFGDG